MNIYKIATIQEHPELKNRAANWFHEKWNIPLEAYLESMEACIPVSYTHLCWIPNRECPIPFGGEGDTP